MIKWLYRLALTVIAALGLFLQLSHYGLNMLLYYTILSNFLVFAYLLYMVLTKFFGDEAKLITAKALRIKGGVTLAIMITFVIYHFLLSPLIMPQAFWRLENLIVHYIVPLGFILDTLLFDSRAVYGRFDPIFWTVTPLAYTFLALFNGFITKWSIPGAPDSPFAYFFINIPKYGWEFVLLNSTVIFISYVLVGYCFMLIKHYVGPKNH